MANPDAAYRFLQRHLNRQAVGFPAARSGADIRLLQKLFTPDEADLALSLSYRPAPLSEIAERAAPQYSAERAERHLEAMFAKGAIGWKTKGGIGHWFLMPLVVGMYEAQDGNPTREFLSAAGAYMRTLDFGTSLLAARPSQMRTIPINQSIPLDRPVATYDQIRSILRSARGPFVVLKCICRVGKAVKKQPCRKTSREETCLGMGDMAAMVLRRRHGREVTRDEALEILGQNEADGLVLQPANARRPEFVCSCCGCCCGMLSMQKVLPHPVDFWACNYQARVAAEACVRCGACVARCQVNAITLSGAGGRAAVNLSRCIGCGLCVPTCLSKAIDLIPKASPAVPPEDEEALLDVIKANRKGALGRLAMLLKVVLRMRQ